ncbi:acetyltransferase [Sorangium cellulosum]|uniref:Acetyltransferase n=1 Tax=Sorangium cellulosum TaxID=56 RepID=A0A150TEW7_SORCE|nr:acetyltransferase [Sorangium cellulosum]
MMAIRPERAGDEAGIRGVHLAAFPSGLEAELVDRLRGAGRAAVSLVAEMERGIVGHVVFSPVTVAGGGAPEGGVGLAPLAVLPDLKGRGVGSALARRGIEACRSAGYAFAVVLGEPGYYARFGFKKASLYGLGNEYAADEAFMAMELVEHALSRARGVVRYSPEFDLFNA